MSCILQTAQSVWPFYCRSARRAPQFVRSRTFCAQIVHGAEMGPLPQFLLSTAAWLPHWSNATPYDHDSLPGRWRSARATLTTEAPPKHQKHTEAPPKHHRSTTEAPAENQRTTSGSRT